MYLAIVHELKIAMVRTQFFSHDNKLDLASLHRKRNFAMLQKEETGIYHGHKK